MSTDDREVWANRNRAKKVANFLGYLRNRAQRAGRPWRFMAEEWLHITEACLVGDERAIRAFDEARRDSRMPRPFSPESWQLLRRVLVLEVARPEKPAPTPITEAEQLDFDMMAIGGRSTVMADQPHGAPDEASPDDGSILRAPGRDPELPRPVVSR